MSDLETTLRRILGCLRARGVRYAVVGGLAVSARTEPRFTRDADLCVALRDGQEAEVLVHGLRADGYELVALVEQEATGRLATARLADSRSVESPTIVDLLFASTGIEEEIVEQAETIPLFAELDALSAEASG